VGVRSYMARGRRKWMVDEWIRLENGAPYRIRKRGYKTKQEAMTALHKEIDEALSTSGFRSQLRKQLTVEEAWEIYKPVSERDNRSFKTDEGRAKHVVTHLGKTKIGHLTQHHIDQYRNLRKGEKTYSGGSPAPATLDRELELLKRVLNYCVKCRFIRENPIADVQLLNVPNVRKICINEVQFQSLLVNADSRLQPILQVAFDTGMRLDEVLSLRRNQIDLKGENIILNHDDTKTRKPRIVPMTSRVVEVLSEDIPTPIRDDDYIFKNPNTGDRWKDIRKMLKSAVQKAGLDGLWFHDMRRSFSTDGVRAGVPETVLMKTTGHKTLSSFMRYNIIDTSTQMLSAK